MSKKNKFIDFSNFKGDLFGGITAGIVALPLALAFGVASGLGPSAGLYGAIFISFFAALFGGTPTQISGPTAPMTAVTVVVVSTVVVMYNGVVADALPIILTIFLLAGLFQILLGIIGVGVYIKFIPSPVVSGFMTAIGVIILITQINPALGYYPKEDDEYVESFKPQAEEKLLEKIIINEAEEGMLVLEDFKETILRSEKFTEADILKESTTLASQNSSGVIGTLKVMPRALKNIDWLEFILVLITIAIIYLGKRFVKSIPAALLSLVIVSCGAYFLEFDYRPIQRIPEGLPEFHFDIFTSMDFGVLSMFIVSALSLSMLGAIDSLLTSVVADNLTNTKHDSNKELVGQGIGNSIAAFFGGIPGAGATIRTVVNINSGGKSKISGMIAGLLLFVILLALAPVASEIPAAVLAGILITVGIDVMDYKGLRSIPKMPKGEVFVMFVVLILSVFWNLLFAVGIGLVLATFMFMKKMSDLGKDKTAFANLNEFKGELDKKYEKSIPDNVAKQIYIEKLYGPLFFGFVSQVSEKVDDIDDIKTIVIRFENVPYIDQTGVNELEKLIDMMNEINCEVLFVGLQDEPKKHLAKAGIISGKLPEFKVFDNFNACGSYMKRTLTDSKGDIK